MPNKKEYEQLMYRGNDFENLGRSPVGEDDVTLFENLNMPTARTDAE